MMMMMIMVVIMMVMLMILIMMMMMMMMMMVNKTQALSEPSHNSSDGGRYRARQFQNVSRKLPLKTDSRGH